MSQHEFVFANGIPRREESKPHIILSVAGPQGGCRVGQALDVPRIKQLIHDLEQALKKVEGR
jgi:hypothetical protein